MDPKSKLLISTGFLLMISNQSALGAPAADEEFFSQLRTVQAVLKSWPSECDPTCNDESLEWRTGWRNFGDWNNGGWKNWDDFKNS